MIDGEELERFIILDANLTKTQNECTRLVLENRKQREVIDELLKLVEHAQKSWNDLLNEKAKAWGIELKVREG